MRYCRALILMAVIAATILPALPAGAAYFVELSRAQSDDQGHYMAVRSMATVPVMGFVALRPGLSSVIVNGIQADIYPAPYHVMNAPADYTTYGFRVPLYLQPYDTITVVIDGDDGLTESYAWVPATDACLRRVAYLHDYYPNDYWWSLRLGNCYAFDNRFVLAVPFFNFFIAREPRFVFGPFFAALAFRDFDDFDRADFFFRRSLDIDDRFFPARLERGEMFERRRDFDHARDEFQEALRLHPEAAEAHWRLGRVALARGDMDMARRNLNEALTRNPNLAVAHESMGRLLAVQGQQDAAATQFREALRTQPNMGPAHAGLGTTLNAQGNPAQAEGHLRAAVRANPNEADMHMHLGSSLAQQGKPNQALHEYRQAVQLNPSSGEARSVLSQAEFRNGNYQAAWQHAHAAQQLGAPPNQAYLQQLRQKMSEPSTPRPPVMTRAGFRQTGSATPGRGGGRGRH